MKKNYIEQLTEIIRKHKKERRGKMPSELCPKCKALRNMTVSISIKKKKNKKKKGQNIFTYSYHCETCNSFVRSDEVEAWME